MDSIAIKLVYFCVYTLTATLIFMQLRSYKDRNGIFVVAFSLLALYWLVSTITSLMNNYEGQTTALRLTIYHIGLLSFLAAVLVRNYAPWWLYGMTVVVALWHFMQYLAPLYAFPILFYLAICHLIIAIGFFLRRPSRNFADIVLTSLFLVVACLVLFKNQLETISPMITASMVAVTNVVSCFALLGSVLLDYRHALKKLINTDTISKLPNRRALFRQLKQLDNSNECYHLLLIQWQGLNAITHDFGYTITDKTILALSAKAQALPLQWYNLSTTQWVVIHQGDEQHISALIDEIAALVKDVIPVSGHDIRLKSSFGFAPHHLAPCFKDKVQLAQLHLAMANKTNCHNTLLPLQDNLLAQLKNEQYLEQSLKQAIQNEALTVVYQPKYLTLSSSKIVGCEALVRWQLDGEWVSPVVFIPLAERYNLISQIDLLVLKKAWQFAASLKLVDFRVAVNFSSVNFSYDIDLHQIIKNLAERYTLPFTCLEIEITEAAIANSQFIIEQLTKLQALGVTIAIDDFGTGFSSLAQVNDLPFNVLKIDRAFISTIPEQDAIARFVLQLAKELNVVVVAEGVETQAQLNWLAHNDCTMVQGFLLSKPISQTELINALHNST